MCIIASRRWRSGCVPGLTSGSRGFDPHHRIDAAICIASISNDAIYTHVSQKGAESFLFYSRFFGEVGGGGLPFLELESLGGGLPFLELESLGEGGLPFLNLKVSLFFAKVRTENGRYCCMSQMLPAPSRQRPADR